MVLIAKSRITETTAAQVATVLGVINKGIVWRGFADSPTVRVLSAERSLVRGSATKRGTDVVVWTRGGSVIAGVVREE